MKGRVVVDAEVAREEDDGLAHRFHRLPGLDVAGAGRGRGGRGARGLRELAEDVRDVAVHRVLAEDEGGGDLAIDRPAATRRSTSVSRRLSGEVPFGSAA